MHKFWTLTAIDNILAQAIDARLIGVSEPQIQLGECKRNLLQILTQRGHEVLNKLTIPKWAKIYIQLLKLDHLHLDQHGNAINEWPESISDLMALPSATQDFEQQKTFISFIVKTLQVFEEEVVDRSQMRTKPNELLSARIKDWLRIG